MCFVMRLLGWIIQQQTASLGDCMALTIHVHQMVIICEFGKHFSFSFVNIPTFIPHSSPPSISSTDWQDANKTFSHAWMGVGINKILRLVKTFYTDELDTNQVSLFLFCIFFISSELCLEAQLTGRSQRSHLQRLHRVLKLPSLFLKLTSVKMTGRYTPSKKRKHTHTHA